jgi:DNA polymerase-4
MGLGDLSAGEGSSRLVARLAAAVAPAGCWWAVENPATFLEPFPLRCLADEEPALVRALEGMGLRTLGELAALPPELLRQALGDESLRVWREARGEGRRSLMTTGVKERLREAHRFDRPQSDPELVASALTVLADRLAVALRAEGLAAGRVTLHLRFHGGARLQRQRSLDPPGSSLGALRNLARELWNASQERRTGVVACELRAERLRATPAESLHFDFDRAREDLAPSIARVRDRFGRRALRWSPEIWMDQSPPAERD